MHRTADKTAAVTGRTAGRGQARAAWRAHPTGAMGECVDIAWAVVWLASDEARLVARAESVIDGGNRVQMT